MIWRTGSCNSSIATGKNASVSFHHPHASASTIENNIFGNAFRSLYQVVRIRFAVPFVSGLLLTISSDPVSGRRDCTSALRKECEQKGFGQQFLPLSCCYVDSGEYQLDPGGICKVRYDIGRVRCLRYGSMISRSHWSSRG